jgi:antitoxin component YwqK of YwqJK toxin-antitoxin module
MSRNYRTSIPKSATETIERSFENGAKEKAFYVLDGEKVGFRQWDEDGALFYEYGIRDGKKHGREYYFHRKDEPYEMTRYRHGVVLRNQIRPLIGTSH